MSEPSPPARAHADATPEIRPAVPARPMLPRSPPAPPLLEAFGAVVDWTVVLIGATMIVLVFVNVVLHVVGKDLAAVTELAELLMVWVTFLSGGLRGAARRADDDHRVHRQAAGRATGRGGRGRRPARHRRCSPLLVWYGVKLVIVGWGNELTVLQIPMSFQYLGMPVGVFAMPGLDGVRPVADPARQDPRRSAGRGRRDAMLAGLLFLGFFALALVGVPLMYSLLVATVGAIVIGGLSHPLETIFLSFIGGVEPFILIAVPLFIFAGEILSSGGVGKRIVELRPGAARVPARRAGRRDRRLVPDVRRRLGLGDRRHRGDRLAGDPVDAPARLLARLRRRAARRRRDAGAADAAVDSVPRLRVHLRRVDAAALDGRARARARDGGRADRRVRLVRPQERLRQRRRARSSRREIWAAVQGRRSGADDAADHRRRHLVGRVHADRVGGGGRASTARWSRCSSTATSPCATCRACWSTRSRPARP